MSVLLVTVTPVCSLPVFFCCVYTGTNLVGASNAAHIVSVSTLAVIKREFERAAKHLNEMFSAKSLPSSTRLPTGICSYTGFFRKGVCTKPCVT